VIIEVVVVVNVVVYFPDIYVSPGFFDRQKLVLLLTRNPKFIIIVVLQNCIGYLILVFSLLDTTKNRKEEVQKD